MGARLSNGVDVISMSDSSLVRVEKKVKRTSFSVGNIGTLRIRGGAASENVGVKVCNGYLVVSIERPISEDTPVEDISKIDECRIVPLYDENKDRFYIYISDDDNIVRNIDMDLVFPYKMSDDTVMAYFRVETNNGYVITGQIEVVCCKESKQD